MINKENAEYVFKSLAFKEKTYSELGKEFQIHSTTLCKQMKQFKNDFGLQDQEQYCAYTFLRYKHKDEIIQKYLKGNSSKTIAQFYGLSDDHLIIRLLREMNVPVRSTGYISKTDQSLFETIDSELSAYVLGLITADGNVSKDYGIHIHLTEIDKPLLEDINQKFYNGTGHFLIENKKTKKNVARLSICGKQICKNLSKYGVVPNKSKILTQIMIFSDELMPHYLRGLFDGDGVCACNKHYLRLGYCAYQKEFVLSFQDYLCDKLVLKKNQLFNTGNCWQCSWGSRQDIKKIYHYFYDNASIFLPRKKIKTYSYLYDNTEVTN